jgi:hypothetical protein
LEKFEETGESLMGDSGGSSDQIAKRRVESKSACDIFDANEAIRVTLWQRTYLHFTFVGGCV